MGYIVFTSIFRYFLGMFSKEISGIGVPEKLYQYRLFELNSCMLREKNIPNVDSKEINVNLEQ